MNWNYLDCTETEFAYILSIWCEIWGYTVTLQRKSLGWVFNN